MKQFNESVKSHMPVRIITQSDLIESGCFDVESVINECENAFKQYSQGNVIFPDKVSVIFNDAIQDRINCLPAGILNERVYGVKWVSVFPENPHVRGLPNLTAVIILSELDSGFPIAFMEGGLCSNLRTAAVSALGAKYFSREECESIGFIGAGEQAKSHFLAMMKVRPSIKICKISSRTQKSEVQFIKQMEKFHPQVKFIQCYGNYKKAALNSDIIVTAISEQDKILKPDWISKGAFYCHVGGLEDDFGVALKADKIVVDNWEVVKHRTQTLSQMYKNQLITDKDIYANLDEVITGRKRSRESNKEFVYFNSVGLSFIDVAVANWMYKKVKENGLGTVIDMKEKSMFET